MVLTVHDCEDHIFHALAGDPGKGVSKRQIINYVGHHLVNMRAWNFLVGKPHHIDLRPSILLTTAAPGTWDEDNLRLTVVGGFSGYSFLEGDQINVTGGANATVGWYAVLGKFSDDAITLAASIGATDGDADIEATFDLATVALPDDFGDVVAAYATNGLVSGLVPTTHANILLRRATAYTTSIGQYWYAISHNANEQVVGGVPQTVFEIWPTPTVAEADYFQIIYRRAWTEITADTRNVPVPDYFAPLFTEMVREYAIGWEAGDVLTIQERMARIQAGPSYAACVRRDGGETTTLGMSQGGAAARQGMRGASLWNWTSISDPA